jgi:hypothetical protein
MPRTLVQHRMLHTTATLDEQVMQIAQHQVNDIQREAGKLINSEQVWRGVGAKKAVVLDQFLNDGDFKPRLQTMRLLRQSKPWRERPKRSPAR